ncbi:MAG: PAS domain S-box protein, partial [Candidatus Heimdallarchaeota archaeon]|nr:PAS domain S-box protein [Candidatus Heimdallarchaeota archaeon]
MNLIPILPMEKVLTLTSDLVFKLDFEGHIMYANQRMEQTLGYPLDTLIGSDFHSYIHHEDHDIFQQNLQKTKLGLELDFSLRLIRHDSEEIVLKIKFSAEGDFSDQNLSVLGVAQDITHRFQAEKVLLKDHIILRNLIDLNPFPIAIYDVSGHFIRANQSFYKLWTREPPPSYCLFDEENYMNVDYKEKIAQLHQGEVISIPEMWINLSKINRTYPDLDVCTKRVLFPLFKDKELSY